MLVFNQAELFYKLILAMPDVEKIFHIYNISGHTYKYTTKMQPKSYTGFTNICEEGSKGPISKDTFFPPQWNSSP